MSISRSSPRKGINHQELELDFRRSSTNFRLISIQMAILKPSGYFVSNHDPRLSRLSLLSKPARRTTCQNHLEIIQEVVLSAFIYCYSYNLGIISEPNVTFDRLAKQRELITSRIQFIKSVIIQLSFDVQTHCQVKADRIGILF